MQKTKIIVFGYGRYYRSKEDNLKKNYEIVGFIDNSIKEGETQHTENALKVLNPKGVDKFEEVPIFIMSAKFMEMWRQLLDMGISEDRIRFGADLDPASGSFEEYLRKEDLTIFSEKGQVLLKNGQESKAVFNTDADCKKWFREKMQKDSYVKMITDMPVEPISRRFGLDKGSAIDRYYIEKFLKENAEYICGDVMEIGDNRYTRAYGHDLTNSYILHVNGWGGIKGNFATGEGIEENMVDCLIFTQTLQHIYDMKNTIKYIYKCLKPNGVVLITSGVIAELSLYDYHNWGEYWRMTDQSLKLLLGEQFAENKIKVSSYGNVKTAIAFLYGLCREDLQQKDFDYNDEQYPLVVAGVARKE